jgi:nucleoside-diphosphate kinase
MAGITTFTMIKPDAFEAGYTGLILQKFIENGFKIKALRLTHLHKEDAEAFYAVHSARPFFNGLVSFMSSGNIVAAVLEKENAVEDFRKLIGATNPAEAADGTVRKLYATSIERNAVHGSDSDENALIESNFFFSHFDRP